MLKQICTAPAACRVLLAGAMLAAGLAACTPRVDTRGSLPDPERVLAVQPGIHTRGEVSEILGSPSSVGTFDDKTWYYMSKRTEQTAFFEPEVLDQQVLVIKFDDAGVVNDMKLYGYEDGRVIDPVSRETPTSGRELTILQQIFGNLGRFTKDQERRAVP